MIFHDTPRYTIYFGNADDALYLDTQTREIMSNNPFVIPVFKKIGQTTSLSQFVFLHQTHSTHGFIFDNQNSLPEKNLTLEGDFIVTNLLHTAIGIFTADCLPLVVYDSAHHVAAIAHVGWKGALAGIVPTMISSLQKRFQTIPGDLAFFFGPSAQPCCYEVKDDFITILKGYPFWAKTILHRDNRFFFNMPLFIQLQLKELGILPQACDMTYNHCTICNHQYFSYRRQQHYAGRHVTFIALK